MTTNDQLPDPQSLGYEEARDELVRIVQTLGYEEARDELVRIVQTLEGGQAPLEDTLTMWERGEALAARCSQILDGAQARLSERTTTPSPEAR
nr:exodeoxyribonuclease VII small subunit [Schaalia odontolytica]